MPSVQRLTDARQTPRPSVPARTAPPRLRRSPSAPPATPCCRCLQPDEFRCLVQCCGGCSGIYFDGFGHSIHLSLHGALRQVRTKSRDALLFLDRGQTTLFLFHGGPVWLCRRAGGGVTTAAAGALLSGFSAEARKRKRLSLRHLPTRS